ncbi:hypothetical protein ACOTVS_09920 [Aliarcobacter butzleri]
MFKIDKNLISIKQDKELSEKRDLSSLDKVVELISNNLKKVDSIATRNFETSSFEEAIFDFIKNEHLIYVIINSKNSMEIKSIDKLENYSKNVEILNKYIEHYKTECIQVFKKELSLDYLIFLNEFSNRFLKYKITDPNQSDKKMFFDFVYEKALNEESLGADKKRELKVSIDSLIS